MKIYDFAAFPNPARVRIALNEKNAADKVEFIEIDVPNGGHLAADFVAKNPSATVPLMELDCGTCISECTAITEYIDNNFDGPSLTGITAKEKAVVHMMQRRGEQYLMDAVGDYFHHATPGLGPDLEKNQNAEWGTAQKERALQGMEYFDTVLADNDFVAGESFSMADITAFVGLGFADFAGVDISDNYKNLAEWRARVAARPSVVALGG